MNEADDDGATARQQAALPDKPKTSKQRKQNEKNSSKKKHQMKNGSKENDNKKSSFS